MNTSLDFLFYSRAMPVATENAQKRLFELLIGEGVAERVDRAVEVAEPVRDVVEDRFNTGQAESHDHRQYVPRRPTQHERSEDDCYGA